MILQRQALHLLLLTVSFSSVTMPSPVTASEGIHANELVQQGNFYTSHPTTAQLIRTNAQHHAVRSEWLLRVSMKTMVPRDTGVRTQHLFFSQSHVSDYIEAIDHFVRLSRDSSHKERLEIARIPSWESYHVRRDLVFEFIPPGEPGTDSDTPTSPLLQIYLAYDHEHLGGSFYFTPANADALLELLFDFIHVTD